MSFREFTSQASFVAARVIIYTVLLFVPFSLLIIVISKLFGQAMPTGWPLFLFDLIIVIIIVFGSIVLRQIKEFLLNRSGIQTTASILESQRCDDNEDACVCGRYHYFDVRGKEYRFKCKICIHWPSNEQWELVKNGYFEGAVNTVYYLPWFPYIHKINFPI